MYIVVPVVENTCTHSKYLKKNYYLVLKMLSLYYGTLSFTKQFRHQYWVLPVTCCHLKTMLPWLQ